MKSGPRVPPEIFRLIVWLYAANHSIRHICKNLGLTDRTVSSYLRRIRAHLQEAENPLRSRLRGVVQLDTYTYRSLNSSRYVQRPILMVMIGADSEARLFTIRGRTKLSVFPIVKENVEMGTVLITNQSKLWAGLKIDGFPDVRQYPAQRENQELSQFFPPGEAAANFWQSLDLKMGHTRGVRGSTFLPIAREVELRWNFRKRPVVDLYLHLLERCASIGRL